MLRLATTRNSVLLLLGAILGAAGAGLIWLGIEERVGFLLDVGVSFAGAGAACLLIGAGRGLWALFGKSGTLGARVYHEHRGFLQPVLVVTALVFVLLAGLIGHNWVVWYTVERDCELALNTEDRVEAQWALTRALQTMDDPLLIAPSDLFDLWGPNRCRSAVEKHRLVPSDPAAIGIDEPVVDTVAETGQPGRPQLLKYSLRDQGYTDEEFTRWLAEQEPYNGLITLVLEGNRLTEASIAALAGSDIGVIHTLLLGGNPLGDAGAATLASEAAFSGLRTLYMPETGLSAAGLRQLFGPDSKLDFLVDLDLSDNDLGDEGAGILGASARVARLTHLYFDNTGLTDRGARALADSPHFGAPEYLSLDRNELTAEAVAYVRERASFAESTVLFFGEPFE